MNSLTYPNGDKKPKYRGYIHKLALYIVPILYSLIQLPYCKSILSIIIGIIYVSAPIVLYYMSSYFHMNTKTDEEHYKWQKRDYNGIYYYIFITNIGFSILLYLSSEYMNYGIIMFIINIIIFGVGVIRNNNKSNSDKKDIVHQFIAGILVSLSGIFIYPITKLLGIDVLIAMIGIWINNGIGLWLYNDKDLLNGAEDIFGHHEWFHMTTVTGEIASWYYKYAICAQLNNILI
jgi:predicted membrane channel-forming protein YqfA (hemolysin III family)